LAWLIKAWQTVAEEAHTSAFSLLHIGMSKPGGHAIKLRTVLEVLNVPRGQGDPDPVNLSGGSAGLLKVLLGGHFFVDWKVGSFVGWLKLRKAAT
jgi:hypothetical protein